MTTKNTGNSEGPHEPVLKKKKFKSPGLRGGIRLAKLIKKREAERAAKQKSEAVTGEGHDSKW